MILIKNKADALVLRQLLDSNDYSDEYKLINSLQGRFLNSADIIQTIIDLKENNYLDIKNESTISFKLNSSGIRYANNFIENARNTLEGLLIDLSSQTLEPQAPLEPMEPQAPLEPMEPQEPQAPLLDDKENGNEQFY
ncbi:MAG: hypothetical protein MR314_05420 [Ezakiella sp.]|nr:hypothetical protein [Ezakiella sp.]